MIEPIHPHVGLSGLQSLLRKKKKKKKARGLCGWERGLQVLEYQNELFLDSGPGMWPKIYLVEEICHRLFTDVISG